MDEATRITGGEPRRERPNVVLIVADDLGYGDLSATNGGRSSTPILDALSASGCSFAQHYAASPVCAPARAALLTGRYPQRTGVVDTFEVYGSDRLSLTESTVADEFRAAGYRTGLVGKWHAGSIGEQHRPLARGFDEFVGFCGGWQDYWDWQLDQGVNHIHSDGRYLTDVLADAAVGFVRRHAAEPFLLHVAFNAPHFPLQAPPETIERFRRPGRTTAVATVYAMIAVMDAGIGRILAATDDEGLAEDTIVFFSSDNGPDFGGAGDACAARFNHHLAGRKGLVFEGGIRVPLIVRWPGRVAPGTVCTEITHGTDWLPTLLDLARLERRRGRLPLDGGSFAPCLLGAGSPTERARYWQWTRREPLLGSNAAVRDGRWKLLRPAAAATLAVSEDDGRIDADIKQNPQDYPVVRTRPGPPASFVPEPLHLFDLERDPGERIDLAAGNPDVVARLTSQLQSWFTDVEHDRADAVFAAVR